MKDKPFLYEWDGIKDEVKYTLVYAESPEKAFEKLDKQLNPTVKHTQIRLATIL